MKPERLRTATLESMTLLGSEVHLQTSSGHRQLQFNLFHEAFPSSSLFAAYFRGIVGALGRGQDVIIPLLSMVNVLMILKVVMRTMKATVYLKAKA